MKCFLVRDLLPYYIEGQVSGETRNQVTEHLKECGECSSLLSGIHSANEEIKESASYVEILESEKTDRDFWRRYYGHLLIKGVSIFFIVFIVILTLISFVKDIMNFIRP